MPNVAALAFEASTMYISNDIVSKAEIDKLISETLGLVSPYCERVHDELLIDAATAIAGSGPAFVLLVVEALADAAVRCGFSRQTGIELATQTVLVC